MGWFDENSPSAGNEPQQLQQAMSAVGVTGTQMRDDPGAQERVRAFLEQNGSPGWQFGGTKAGDWVQAPSGAQMDYLNSKGDTFQWVPDPATSPTMGQMGATGGGPNNLYLPDSLDAGWTTPFQAPSAAQARATPGYQFLMDEGTKAVERGAASKGTLLTGGTQKALAGWAQGLADTTYQQTYQNSLGEYLNAYNIFRNNQGDLFNRLSTLSGQGLNAAGGTAGAIEGGANAGAAGAAGTSTAWGNAVGGLATDALTAATLPQTTRSSYGGQPGMTMPMGQGAQTDWWAQNQPDQTAMSP